MAHPGRLRKYNPIADDIRRAIKIVDNAKAQNLILDSDIEILDGYARTPLFHAVIENNIEILNWLIAKGANLNHQDREGFCALYFASLEKNIDAATILLKNGASTDLRDIFGNTPLWRAAHSAHGNYGILLLLSHFRSQESWCERRIGQSQVDCVENRLSVFVCSGDVAAHLAKGG